MIKEPTLNNAVNNDIIDLDLSVTKKKKLRFDKDDNRIVEVNTSDMNLMQRVNIAYPKLKELQEKASKLTEGLSAEENKTEADALAEMSIMAERLTAVDAEMRELLDYMFDAPVSAAAAPSGSMYDPFNGNFRYEHIVAIMMNQYEANLQSEFKQMEKQLKKHTEKYTRR
jgi:hypothetical protein